MGKVKEIVSKVVEPLFWGMRSYKGNSDNSKQALFPKGLFRLSCTGPIVVTHVNASGEPEFCYVLDRGLHWVKGPSDVYVKVECDEEVWWSVHWPRRWTIADSTRVEAPLLRPRTQQEELKEYINHLFAQVTGKEEVQVDVDQEDYDDDGEEFNLDAPESIYQLNVMVKEMQDELARRQKLRPKDDSSPVVEKPKEPKKPAPKGKEAVKTPIQADIEDENPPA